MVIFNSDLDNTLIYSYKHDIGSGKKCVEVYEKREISFITDKTYEMLKKIKEKVLFVPTTTRTMEQYNRIDLGIGVPKYALVCNGGVLLVNGKIDETWYEESLRLVANCNEELKKGEELLEKDENRNFEVRNIRSLFLFSKSKSPQKTIEMLKGALDCSLVDIFANGVKVYVVPRKLNKGNGVRRLKEKLNAKKIIAAGDSEFDVPMLQVADVGIAPKALEEKVQGEEVLCIHSKRIFSEEVLELVLEECS